MKRSEMIRHILDYLGRNYPDYCDVNELFSETLLDHLESKGITPPLNNKGMSIAELLNKGDRYTWEPEDES